MTGEAELTAVAVSEEVREWLPVATMADLRLMKPTATRYVELLGYYTKGDGGGGSFYFDTSSSATDNGGTIIAPDAGGVGRWVRIYSGDVVHAAWFGVKWDNSTDDATDLNAALAFVGTEGGGVVQLPEGAGLVGATVYLPDYTTLRGVGRNATTLKLKSSTNADIILKHASYSGYNASIRDMTIDGNDTNNTSGGIYWAGSTGSRGPSLLMQNVKITNMRGAVGGGGLGAAMLITGSDWSVLEDVDFWYNINAVGLWVKSPDCVFNRLYMASNGSSGALQALVVQQANANIFNNCYFGGGTGASNIAQVTVLGSKYCEFNGCINDSSPREAYRFLANGGIESNYNSINGGKISNASQAANNTYDMVTFEDAATGNIINGVVFDNTLTNKGRYGVAESGTATANKIDACAFGTLGTGNTNLRSAGTSTVDNVKSGTWTPTLRGSSTAGTQTYANQFGWYRKIGDLVIGGGYVRLSAADGTTAGNLEIAGLPFTSSNASSEQYGTFAVAQHKFDLTAGYTDLSAQIANNTTVALIVQNGDNVTPAAIGAAGLLADSRIMFTFSYLAA